MLLEPAAEEMDNKGKLPMGASMPVTDLYRRKHKTDSKSWVTHSVPSILLVPNKCFSKIPLKSFKTQSHLESCSFSFLTPFIEHTSSLSMCLLICHCPITRLTSRTIELWSRDFNAFTRPKTWRAQKCLLLWQRDSHSFSSISMFAEDLHETGYDIPCSFLPFWC